MKYRVMESGRLSQNKIFEVDGTEKSFTCPKCKNQIEIIRFETGATTCTGTYQCNNCGNKYSILYR